MNISFGKHHRTIRTNKNIFYSFFIKGISILVQLMLVPLTLNYLDKAQYGIWLTVASIMGWFSFFDIGIGNGLRNKLAEAIANNDESMAKIYVSTSYALVSIIFLSLMVLFWIINPFLNWASILNTPESLNVELSKMILFVFSLFCLQFILNLIGTILFAKQKSALNNLIAPLGNIFSIIIIYILTITTKSSLFWVAVTFSAAPVVILLFFNLFLFQTNLKNVSPGIKHINFNYSKGLLGLGFQFFIIQIAAMVLFTTSNIIITQLFGPEEVANYNIGYKYFSVIAMVHGIIITPFWSAMTEAFVKKDFEWIKKTIKRLEWIGYGLVLVSVLMFFIANFVYQFWVGESISIPLLMNLMLCLAAVVSVLSRPYNTFINGIGKVSLQLYTAIISIIITIPLALFFAKTLNWGPAGVAMATVCTTLPTAILWRIQYNKILAGTATGIWDR
jgi:O-antigen/teichoic acid export membrane protein